MCLCAYFIVFQLLKEDKKQLSFWTFEYYQQFFDVETRQVFHRVVGSMLPLPHRNFLQTHIRPTPDLYGNDLSRVLRKPILCICENKGSDQLSDERAADQCLCFFAT